MLSRRSQVRALVREPTILKLYLRLIEFNYVFNVSNNAMALAPLVDTILDAAVSSCKLSVTINHIA